MTEPVRIGSLIKGSLVVFAKQLKNFLRSLFWKGIPYRESAQDILGQPVVIKAPPALRMIVRLSQEVL